MLAEAFQFLLDDARAADAYGVGEAAHCAEEAAEWLAVRSGITKVFVQCLYAAVFLKLVHARDHVEHAMDIVGKHDASLWCIPIFSRIEDVTNANAHVFRELHDGEHHHRGMAKSTRHVGVQDNVVQTCCLCRLLFTLDDVAEGGDVAHCPLHAGVLIEGTFLESLCKLRMFCLDLLL